jgi:hypothetical protein
MTDSNPTGARRGRDEGASQLHGQLCKARVSNDPDPREAEAPTPSSHQIWRAG